MNEWMDDASCVETSPDIFFADPIRQPMSFQAVKICKRCPVRKQCLDYALDEDYRFGIWGGMFPSERRVEQKRRLKDG